MSLFLITVDLDGDIRVQRIADEARFLADLAVPGEGYGNHAFRRSLTTTDPNHWYGDEDGGSALLIRGEIVVPEPVETVTKFRLSDDQQPGEERGAP